MPKAKPRLLKRKYEADPHDPDSTFPLMIEVYSRTPGTGAVDVTRRGGREYLRARVWIDDEKGRHKRKSVYGKTETELNRKVRALRAAPQQNVKKITVTDFLEQQFLPGIRERVRFSTFSTYRTAVREYISPVAKNGENADRKANVRNGIGRVKLAALTGRNVDAWLTDLKANPRSKALAFATLRVAYTYAVGLGLLERSPLAGMKAPRFPKSEPRVLSLEEVQKLLATARGSEWFPLLYLAVVTSMRFGELAGLQWRSVDLKAGFLRVTQALARTEGGLALTEPKTRSSRRRVDLPGEAVEMLLAHRKTQIDSGHDLVFTAPGGGFIDSPNFTKRVFRPLLKRAGLPTTATFHGLRHASNTILAASGIPLKVLQGRLGHSTSKTTMDVYTHSAGTDGRLAADRIGTLLSTSGDTFGGQSSREAPQDKQPDKQKTLIL
jgi:integrase